MEIVKPCFGKGAGCKISPDCFVDFSQPIIRYMGVNLPHWEQVGKLQYITMRLADSLPNFKIEELQSRKIQLQNTDSYVDQKEYLNEIDRLLAIGKGSCILKYDEIQKLIRDALLFYDGVKYDLYEYVIMPNHIHFIILPYTSMKIIMTDFKRYTTGRIKKILGTRDNIWQNDYFDRFVRDDKDYREIAEYIRLNPMGIKKI